MHHLLNRCTGDGLARQELPCQQWATLIKRAVGLAHGPGDMFQNSSLRQAMRDQKTQGWPSFSTERRLAYLTHFKQTPAHNHELERYRQLSEDGPSWQPFRTAEAQTG